MIELGGQGIVPLLEQLLEDDDQLGNELRAALRWALRHQTVHAKPDTTEPV